MSSLHFDNKHGSTSRKVTFMMYLNSPESDCGTHFPRAAPLGAPAGTPPGIKVMPRKGRAILFYNIRNGVEDDASLHEGSAFRCASRWGNKRISFSFLNPG